MGKQLKGINVGKRRVFVTPYHRVLYVVKTRAWVKKWEMSADYGGFTYRVDLNIGGFKD